MAKFTTEEKIRIVLRYLDGQESMLQVAKEEGVNQPEFRTLDRVI